MQDAVVERREKVMKTRPRVKPDEEDKPAAVEKQGTSFLFTKPSVDTPSLKPSGDPGVARSKVSESTGDIRKQKNKAGNYVPGSSRGIETMFRTAYRAQLDLTALAATKANIMISLNGLIISVLTLSGPFVLVAEPMFTAPIAVFLATCLCTIIFAVLAARPRLGKNRNTVEDFRTDDANILVFEHFSSLSIDEYTKVMVGQLSNNRRIYKNMSRQLYLLGVEAHRKYRLLKYSYMTFLAGLTVSTVMLLAIGLLYHTHSLDEIMSSLQSRTIVSHQ